MKDDIDVDVADRVVRTIEQLFARIEEQEKNLDESQLTITNLANLSTLSKEELRETDAMILLEIRDVLNVLRLMPYSQRQDSLRLIKNVKSLAWLYTRETDIRDISLEKEYLLDIVEDVLNLEHENSRSIGQINRKVIGTVEEIAYKTEKMLR